MTIIKPIRWGIIGGGTVVEKKSGPGFNIPGLSQVEAVMRRDGTRAKTTCSILGANKWYTEVQDLLCDADVDAIYIATPPGLHYEQAKLCCEAGKPVYIEKPFTVGILQANDLVDAFNAAGIPIFVAHYRRALQRFQMARHIISTRIGYVVDFDFRLKRNLADDINHPWLYCREISGGGKFADIAPHSIDILLYLFGDMSEVLGVAHHIMSPNKTEDAVCIAFRTTEGIIGSANYNFLSNDRSDQLSVYGTKGELHLSIHGNLPMREIIDGKENFYDIPLPECIEAPMIQQVVDYLHGKESTPCFGLDAIPTVRIIEDVLKTLQ